MSESHSYSVAEIDRAGRDALLEIIHDTPLIELARIIIDVRWGEIGRLLVERRKRDAAAVSRPAEQSER